MLHPAEKRRAARGDSSKFGARTRQTGKIAAIVSRSTSRTPANLVTVRSRKCKVVKLGCDGRH